MMFDHLKLAIAVVLRPTVYASAPDRAYASQLSDGLPK